MIDIDKHKQAIEKQIVKGYLDDYIDDIVDTYVTESGIDFTIPNMPNGMTEREIVGKLAHHLYRKHLPHFLTRSINKNLEGEVVLEFKLNAFELHKTLIEVMSKKMLVLDNREMLNELATEAA